MAELMGLDWRQQKELLKLRARLSFRQFMGEKGRLLVAILTVVMLAPVVVGLAIGSGVGYFMLPDPWPAQLMGFVLLFSWGLWSVAPVLSFNVNEGLDPTRLLVYPISRRDFLAHLLLGTLLDYPTYFLIPFALAIIAGFGLGLSLPIVLVALFLAYLLMVFTSQTVVSVLGGVLRSRRFRDIMVIVGAGFGMSCWAVSMFFQGPIEEFMESSAGGMESFLLTWQPLEFI
ncbi:MAG TPA: hypothetical protein VK879_08765, partial [Candidatus Sulfomarinibacteraceae bacterium]|nr:hypothetical protein [Candidatus Sulfomarinibacteraceae bacterium]